MSIKLIAAYFAASMQSVRPGASEGLHTLRAVLAVGLLTACGADPPVRLTHIAGTTMGTHYNIKLVNRQQELSTAQLRTNVDAILARVNQQMSTYRSDSELSRLNRNATTEWIGASTDLLTVIDAAGRISRLTGGAFDITVAPLVDLWGFGPAQSGHRVPTHQELQEALARVGYAMVLTRRSPPAIRKLDKDLNIDLSAIAKGFAVDRICEYLESVAVADYMVEIGGDLRVRGRNDRGAAWSIAVESPRPGNRRVQRLLQLHDQAMATSGDYRNYFERDGLRYSHTINPIDGLPVSHNLASVTVLSDTAMVADALATALLVLGPEAGPALAEHQRLGAYFIMRTADGYAEQATPQFDRFVSK